MNIIVFPESKFQQPALFQYQGMIWDAEVFLFPRREI